MRTEEASAKTRQEAIQKALDELGVELHEVEIEVVDEGSKGFLGIGVRKVIVRVTAEHLPAKEPEEKPSRDRKRRGSVPQKESRRKKPSSRPKPSQTKAHSAHFAGSKARPQPAPRRTITEGKGKEAAVLLQEIIAKMGIESEVSCSTNDANDLVLDVSSLDSAILIGRKGRNLSALQFLMNSILFNTKEDGGDGHIVVDVEGYLDRRRSSLEEMAIELAKRAVETERSVRVDPLSPQERRIVHLTLESFDGVRTSSDGKGVHRTILIVPDNEKSGDRPSRQRSGGRRRGHRGGTTRRPSDNRVPEKVATESDDRGSDGND